MSGNAFGVPQRWKVVAQVGVAQLDDPLGAGEVAQMVAAQIGQPGIIGELVCDDLLGCAEKTVWPPWARSRSRAVLLIVGPM